MPFSLSQVSRAHLEALRDARTPPDLAERTESEALPPPRVAIRALRFLDEGRQGLWASTFFIVRDEDQKIVGSCGFKGSPKHGRVEVGYGVSPACRRQGVATSAVTQLVGLAFSAGANEVLAQVSPENLASSGVLLKLGFRNLGLNLDEEGVGVMHWVAARSDA